MNGRPVPLWRRVWRVVRTVVFLTLAALLIGFIVLNRVAPDLAGKWFPYRLYTVVTDSMVPTIPVNSLVVIKNIAPDQELVPGTIVTFKANRFGTPIVLTHYLDSVEEYEGQARYRTHAEGTDYKDDYVTLRGDLLGTYVTHIAGLGKLFLFLTSTYALVMYAVIAVILIAYGIARARYSRGGGAEERGLRFRRLKLTREPDRLLFTGEVSNKTKDSLIRLRVRLILLDGEGGVLRTQELELVSRREGLPAGESQYFFYSTDDPLPADSFRMELVETAFAPKNLRLEGKSEQAKDRHARR